MRTRQIARLTAGLYEAENRTPNQILLVVFKLVIGLPLISLFFSDLCKMLMVLVIGYWFIWLLVYL